MTKIVIENTKVCMNKALPVISAICDKIGLVQTIDKMVGPIQDKRIVSTGNAVKAMVMSIVSGRKPMYKLENFFMNTDTEKMLGKGIMPYNITDDMLARALDDVFEIGPKKVMTEMAMSSINTYKIPVKSIHADTTSKSLYGEYENEDETHKNAIKIKRGHSKDFRPDLKQILFGLGTTKERIVVIGNVCNGNTSDKEWNKDILKDLRVSMIKYGLKDFIYVADSAAVTEGMLKELAGDHENPSIEFVSRCPGNYNLEKEMKQKALEDSIEWEKVGYISDKPNSAEYKIKSYQSEMYGRMYRFLVCHSSQLNTLKEKTLEKNIKVENESALKKIICFQKIEFFCEKDAIDAFERFEDELSLKYHTTIGKVETSSKVLKRGVRGRPKNGQEINKSTVYSLKISLYKEEERIKEYKEKESLFVLITNILDENKMSNTSILSEYKGQFSVETSFKVLKDPYFIDELFYKKPHRVEALAYIMLISLMILTLLERTVRENLKGQTERVMVSGKRRSLTPTGISIVETFENIQTYMIYKDGIWKSMCSLDKNLQRLIRLAGFETSVYADSFENNE